MNLYILLNLYVYMIFIPLILISSLMILISTSWFSQWMIMEINLIGFLSLLMFEKKNSSEISMNYFLIQSFNSYLFIVMSINLNLLNSLISDIAYLYMNLSLLTKMGLPPFYIWYLKIMKNLNWLNLFILMTIQKFIPLMIFINLINYKISDLVMMFNMLNLISMAMICSILGLQNLSLKLILSYSSIIQMSWMIMLIYLNEMMMMNYLMIYFFISLILCIMFKKFNLNFLNDLSLLKFNFKWMYLMMMMMMMSLASIPPFLGFMMKWISIQSMYLNYSMYMLLVMIMNSLISMFFYIRIMFLSLTNLSISMKFNMIKINYISKFSNYLMFYIWMMLVMLMIYEIF